LTYVNHGCNYTDNLGDLGDEVLCSMKQDQCEEVSELTDLKNVPSHFATFDEESRESTPAYLRHLDLFYSGFNNAKININAGDEIFQNYLMYESTKEDFLEEVERLRGICTGQDAGEVTKYENGLQIY